MDVLTKILVPFHVEISQCVVGAGESVAGPNEYLNQYEESQVVSSTPEQGPQGVPGRFQDVLLQDVQDLTD